ncbi:MAG: TolC family protein [Polyangiaceae bacterium]|nr:TolC family protein [Polyangiaceae bacterium]
MQRSPVHRVLRHPGPLALCVISLSSAVAAQPAAPAAPAAAPAPGAAPPAAAAPAPGARPSAGAAASAGPEGTDSTIQLRQAPELKDPLVEALTPKSGGLTANEVARRAVTASDTLAAKRAEIDAAAAKVDEAVATFLPRLTLTASYTRLSELNNTLSSGGGGLVGGPVGNPLQVGNCQEAVAGDPTTLTCVVTNAQAIAVDFPSLPNNYSLKANLNVPFSDYLLRLSSSIATTKHNKRAAELNELATRRKTAADARVAFYNWTRGIGQLVVSQTSLERVNARLQDARVAFELGSATRADVLRLEALVASTQAGIDAVHAFRDLSAEQLSTIMKDPRREYELGEDVMAPVPLEPAATLAEAVDRAAVQRLELQALGESSQALRESVTVMRRGQLPRLDGFATYEYANPNQRVFPQQNKFTGTWMAGVALTYVVNDYFSNGAIAKELEAQRRGLEAQRRALKDGVRMEVTAAYLDGRKARAALVAAQRGTEAARAAYDVATELYRVGRATTTDVIEAESELVAAQLQLVNAYIDERVARTQLVYAMGGDLDRVE